VRSVTKPASAIRAGPNKRSMDGSGAGTTGFKLIEAPATDPLPPLDVNELLSVELSVPVTAGGRPADPRKL